MTYDRLNKHDLFQHVTGYWACWTGEILRGVWYKFDANTGWWRLEDIVAVVRAK